MRKMYRITLTLTLKGPVVISQSNATKGIHQSLDYIPGANILGAVAAQCYANIKDESKAFDVFHSGRVRFGNALPLVNGKLAYPVPLSFHYGKGQDKQVVKNGLVGLEFDNGVQPKQYREGYINAESEFFIPAKHSNLRTAINPDSGTAKEAALFGYQALNAGLKLQSYIDADDEGDLELIKEYLKDFRIGRSRSAHYGRVEVCATEIETVTLTEQQTGRLILWLSSDLVVYNQVGQPTLTPTLEDLGLGNANNTINEETSFIRTRKYATYNGKRHSYDVAKQVIMQGSVLVYDNAQEIDVNKLYQGLGAYTEAGYGQVVPLSNPEWCDLICGQDLQLKAALNDEKESNNESKDSPLPLLQFLQAKQTLQENREVVNQQVELSIEEIFRLYSSIRKLTNSPIVGPSKSQWGLVREVATNAKTTELCAELFTNDGALIQDNDKSNNPWAQRNNQYSFAQCLQKIVNEHQDLALKKLLIRTLARDIASHADFSKHHEGKK